MWLLINYLGYGELFGPIQFGESTNAFPDMYFKPVPSLHCTEADDESGHIDCACILLHLCVINNKIIVKVWKEI